MHEDIDKQDEDTPQPVWHQFLDWFHKVIYEHVSLKESDEVNINVRVNERTQCCARMYYLLK